MTLKFKIVKKCKIKLLILIQKYTKRICNKTSIVYIAFKKNTKCIKIPALLIILMEYTYFKLIYKKKKSRKVEYYNIMYIVIPSDYVPNKKKKKLFKFKLDDLLTLIEVCNRIVINYIMSFKN